VASQIGKLIKIFGKYFKMKNQDLPKKYYYWFLIL
jgi:uncharacterized protein (DUF3820 family)